MDKLLLYGLLKNKSGAEISASGNPAIMSDTLKNNPMNEMKVYGWSKQETTTGAQLFPTITPSIEEKNGITVEYMEHGKIHISGTAEKTVDFMTPTFELLAGTHTLSMGINIDDTLMRCTLSTAKGLPYFDMLNNEASKTETTEDNMILYLLLRVYGGKTIDITIQPMLNTGTSPLPWEPYTGGQPSPSPEYPQEIISAGSDGKIGMEVRGKNLFDFSRLVSDGVNVMDYEKQTITVPAKTNNTGYNQTLRDLCPGITPGIYVFSMKRSNPESGNGSYFLEIAKDFPTNTPIELTDTHLDSHISWYNNPDSEVENVISEIQIEKGNAVTSYEPYHEPQSLSIQTPTGLPAIPVTSGGNYTDADGQQWIADYIDLKRGKYVQMVQTAKVPNDANWSTQTQSNGYKIGYRRIFADGISTQVYGMKKTWKSNMGESKDIWSNKFSFGKSNVFWIIPYENEGDLTSDDINAWLTEHPMDIMYPLVTPIEHDLTQDEIKAYQNLVTYAGTTIVENDAECYMEVSAGGGDSLRAKKLALILGD